MRQMITYVIIVIIAVILLVIINSNNKKIKVIPIEENSRQVSSQAQGSAAGLGQAQIPAVKSAITITKKPVKKPAPGLKEEKNPENNQKVTATVYSSEGSSVSAKISNNTDKPVSGITKVGSKIPTKEESKELNQQGIIMY